MVATPLIAENNVDLCQAQLKRVDIAEKLITTVAITPFLPSVAQDMKASFSEFTVVTLKEAPDAISELHTVFGVSDLSTPGG